MGRRTRVATCFLAGISRGGVLMMDRFKFRRRLCLGMTGLLIGSGLIVAAGADPANAATGDLVGSVTFSQASGSGIGIGITYDGSNLGYSSYSSSPHLPPAHPKPRT